MNEQIKQLLLQPLDTSSMLAEALAELELLNQHIACILENPTNE